MAICEIKRIQGFLNINIIAKKANTRNYVFSLKVRGNIGRVLTLVVH